MLIAFFLLTLIILTSIRGGSKNLECALSVEQTQAIKGIFVITVFLHHFGTYVALDDGLINRPLLEFRRWIGQLMVAPFLFYSGYGIFESVKRKGNTYIKNFPKRRVLKTLFHFDLAILLFFIFNILMDKSVSLSDFLLSLIAWKGIGNSTWFIFAILCEYIFSFIGLTLFKNNLKKVSIVITLLSFVYMILIFRYKEFYWIDTILAFPLGAAFSLCKDKLRYIACRYLVMLCGFNIFVFFFARLEVLPSSTINSQIALVAFCVMVVFFSFLFSIKSKLLSWFGGYVFEIYILQRLPMNFGKHMHWNEQNIYLYFLFCFVVTLFLAVGFKKMTKRIDAFLFKG